MTMTDPIADLFTRIRNGHIAKHDRVLVPASRKKVALCEVLKEQGYIDSFEVSDDPPGKKMEIILRYDHQGTPAITKISRVSKPGRRVYKPADDLRPVLNGLGVAVISTSQGLLTDQQARERRVGGEVVCEIY